MATWRLIQGPQGSGFKALEQPVLGGHRARPSAVPLTGLGTRRAGRWALGEAPQLLLWSWEDFCW